MIGKKDCSKRTDFVISSNGKTAKRDQMKPSKQKIVRLDLMVVRQPVCDDGNGNAKNRHRDCLMEKQKVDSSRTIFELGFPSNNKLSGDRRTAA